MNWMIQVKQQSRPFNHIYITVSHNIFPAIMSKTSRSISFRFADVTEYQPIILIYSQSTALYIQEMSRYIREAIRYIKEITSYTESMAAYMP